MNASDTATMVSLGAIRLNILGIKEEGIVSWRESTTTENVTRKYSVMKVRENACISMYDDWFRKFFGKSSG